MEEFVINDASWTESALAVIVGKVLTCSFGAFVGGNDTRTSLRVGMGLAQIGEFSFIIASLGVTLKVTSGFLYPIAVAVSAITTLVTPYLIRSSDGLVGWFDRNAPRPLVNSLELYTRWVGQLGSQGQPNMAGKLVRRWIGQMALNTALYCSMNALIAFTAPSASCAIETVSGLPGAVSFVRVTVTPFAGETWFELEYWVGPPFTAYSAFVPSV